MGRLDMVTSMVAKKVAKEITRPLKDPVLSSTLHTGWGSKGARRIVVGAVRCIGACEPTVGGHRETTPTPTAVALSALKRGRAVTRRPSRSPTLKGLALVPCISIGLHYNGMVLLEGITRRQWATHRLPGPHHTRGRKAFTMKSQRSSRPVASDCMLVFCLRLLADWSHGCTLFSSVLAECRVPRELQWQPTRRVLRFSRSLRGTYSGIA
jgi:hypothetical protein